MASDASYSYSLTTFSRSGKLLQIEYALTAVGDGPGSTSRTDTAYTIRTDLPTGVGGQDSAPQPVELLLAALLGCKTATAHFVARNLWERRANRIDAIAFDEVVATRDERGALALPISAAPPVTAALLSVGGRVRVRPRSGSITPADVEAMGRIVEERCPVAATLSAAGVRLEFEWVLDPSLDDSRQP